MTQWHWQPINHSLQNLIIANIFKSTHLIPPQTPFLQFFHPNSYKRFKLFLLIIFRRENTYTLKCDILTDRITHLIKLYSTRISMMFKQITNFIVSKEKLIIIETIVLYWNIFNTKNNRVSKTHTILLKFYMLNLNFL